MRYCSFCGQELVLKSLSDGSVEKYCLVCDHVFFDTPSPAVIVAVTKANSILLSRSIRWTHPYWGLISGYVKSGETAEEAAIREVREEVGLDIFDIKIVRTYTLKRDNLLMIGFLAKTKNSHVTKSGELKEARWFNLNDQLPMRSKSIAAQVVDQIKNEIDYVAN